MIKRVVLHESRFQIPGLVPDSRGIVLGPFGIVLLAGPEKLIAFLRAAGEEGALDEMLDSLRIVQVISPLRTREMIVEIQTGGSHRMDRVAAIARLIGGMTFTGSGRHYVKYRDAQGPLGYDTLELLSDQAEFCLYHDRFSQPYRADRVISVRDLVLRLAPLHAPRLRSDIPRTLYALAHVGLGESLVSYLARWVVNARVALVEWSKGGTSNAFERAHLFQLQTPAPRFVNLLRSLPGVTMFVPDGDRVVVELGYRHPIPLTACAPLFASDEMVLFRAAGLGAITLSQRPPFVDVHTVLSLGTSTHGAAQQAEARELETSFSLPLTLMSSPSPPKRVAAIILPRTSQETLGQMLALMPPATLARLTVAFTDASIYVFGPDAVHNVPLGVMYQEYGDGVFVPIGMTISPPVPADVLRQLAKLPRGSRIFVTGGKFPITSVREEDFVAASRLLLSELPIFEETIVGAPLDGDRPLPNLWPDPPGMLAGLTSPGARGPLPPSRGDSAGTIVATALLPEKSSG